VGPRELTVTAVCAACIWVAAAGCAPERGANVVTSPTLASTDAGGGASPVAPQPPIDLTPESALGLGPDDGEMLVQTSVLRAHPVGVHIGPVFGMWLGWRSTLRAVARDPVADLDWLDVVGPSDAAGQRMVARVADGPAAAALDGRLVALQARSAEPAASHVDGRMPAAAARLDGVLRVVFRPQPRLVAATSAASGPALSRVLARARMQDPATEPLEAVRIDRRHPHDAVRLIPPGIRRIRARVMALANGDAEGNAEGDCDSAEEAARAATDLRETVARQNFPLVRMLTHGLLDGLAVTSEGPVVRIHLHASRDQLEAVLSLVTAMAPGSAGP
jgi:hypothetical protein